MTDAQRKIAKILRTDARAVEGLERILEKFSGRFGILDKILLENNQTIHKKLEELNLGSGVSAQEIFDALVSKVEADDVKLVNYLKIADIHYEDATKRVLEFIKKIFPPYDGWFLKKEKFIEFLKKTPPPKIMEALGYKSVDDLIRNENIYEIFAALRFLEGNEWLNTVFFQHYKNLTFRDFEKRKIELLAISSKWRKAAERFVQKKYHNVSHLKEFGVIFVIPLFLGVSGETLRLLSLLLHYMHEIQFYSQIFERIGRSEHFAHYLVYLLRGESIEKPLPQFLVEVQRPRFLIIARYLAKDDENDWRLFEPHVNPEALHWEKAINHLSEIKRVLPDFENGLDFWQGSDWVGDFFAFEDGWEFLIGFNLIDTAMSLVKKQELIKYLYHHQEALWNKIFEEYFGKEKLEELIMRNIVKGYIEI